MTTATLEAAPVAEYLEAGSESGTHHVRLKGWRYVVIELSQGVYWVVRSRYNDDGRIGEDSALRRVALERHRETEDPVPDRRHEAGDHAVLRHGCAVQASGRADVAGVGRLLRPPLIDRRVLGGGTRRELDDGGADVARAPIAHDRPALRKQGGAGAR